ncbi:MAG: sugar-binding transcriptional regulator [Cereibacter changlensis]|jgi:deoxyribonucleoside regulator|uniref:Transcriptional regulator n=2 Tax=Cereibacter changlensis TaxID=402884 RepID=A0A2T4JSW2_9RHOB|nr:sugar-binding transcriptional regulator [Cereibacter changlensis]MBZ4689180.1 Transcriptional regulator, contains sigma factor-related N-terminal domain [Cereibacter sp.]PTE20995.1 transcriptional regulator [Cereibacter changlensis JA139]PZX56175.1 deoxyribonucleoside regulator [Cereibacter changlensis]TKA97441.1 sugar-binding transcriptional regulator [Cereibacter changlensis]
MTEDTDRASNRLPLEGGRDQLMVSIARMTYQQDKTLTDIAAETGLNRWQVSRLLQEARDLGIVRIEIVPRTLRHPDLEARLIHAFGLQDAIVVPGPAEQGPDGVAQAAGQYLAALKPKPRSIGVSWGRTMAAVAHWLPPDWADGISVIQINGTVAPVPGIAHHNDVAETFARKGKGRMIPLPVPAIVGERLTREVLEKDRIVADVLRQANAAQVLAFSLGVVGEASVLMRSGNILKSEMAGLLRSGAVGDVLGHFIDRRGEIVDPELDARTIGLTLSNLKRRDRSIGIASGQEKHEITLGTLKAGLVTVLVTDEATATFALEHAHDR